MIRRSGSGRYWDWPLIVQDCLDHPGKWAVALRDEPARLLRTVKDKSAPELHVEGGVIEARVVNEYTNSEGKKRGDIILRYQPNTAPPEE